VRNQPVKNGVIAVINVVSKASETSVSSNVKPSSELSDALDANKSSAARRPVRDQGDVCMALSRFET
jgi:hypothetical protein